MKPIYIHILAVASLTLVACGNEDIEPSAGNVAPTFAATIEGIQSRAIGSVWEPEDEIGITTAYTSSKNNDYNLCHVVTDIECGKFTVKNHEDQIYFKTDSQNGQVTFKAYYPYVYIANISSNKTIDIDTSDQTKQKTFDILYATAKASKDAPEVDFEFTHKMSKVTLIFRNGNGFNVSNIASCRLGDFSLNCKFNVTDGELTSLSNLSDVGWDLSDFEVKDGEPVPPFILIPQTVQGSGSGPRPVNLEVANGEGVKLIGTISFPSNKLEPGNNYVFTVTVNMTGLTVYNCTIENWNDYKWPEGGGSGTAGSADDPDE